MRFGVTDCENLLIDFATRVQLLFTNWVMIYYAALLPRRGPHIASHYVCLSVRLSVCLSVRPVIVTERHVTPPSELQ